MSRAVLLGVVGALVAAAILGLVLLTGADRDVVPRVAPQPYVITAIDYHFHDAHPTLPITSDRDLVVKNVGLNRHNVTIPALGYSHNVASGNQITIPNVAGLFGGPGRYPMFCRFHRDRGMKGVIVIAAGE